MFLDVLRRRNSGLIEAAIHLHQEKKLPANSYVIDTDTVERNAGTLRETADRHGLKIFAMTKQMGRNGDFCAAVRRGGITESVAVDMECARATHRAGLTLGHLGHLVQVPRAEAAAAARMKPRYWTVFNDEKAGEAVEALRAADHDGQLLARIQAEGDTFYRGHEGGFPAADIVAVAERIERLGKGRFAGITTFPAQLFDPATRSIRPTHNTETLRRAADALAAAGRKDIEINAPGTTSSVMIPALADVGATQCEPGHGLTGTTPLHALEDLPEAPAVVYLSEVSHLHGGRAYCFGGGLYIDPVFPDYDVKAVVSREPTTAQTAQRSVEIPPPAAIDYYGMIDASGPAAPRVGDSVVFGFRAQAFVTRAYVVGISGLASGSPQVQTIHDAYGRPIDWPEW
ncbi:amino-acid racemase [Mesorhizobium sp. L-8-10]|uniref:alanine racemase n=1 Tax=Mesorhizobium sp. L-8-10 TaxID=2744523 RepID=UPI0019277832|nr:alanine racemase [Mesorhizobium sp. L-8-10]BCH30167.1 amino-acid racemase [Mesorhizobium sp. L-8-10]